MLKKVFLLSKRTRNKFVFFIFTQKDKHLGHEYCSMIIHLMKLEVLL